MGNPQIKIQILENKNALARVEIKFFECIVIKGFTIKKNKDGVLFLTPPCTPPYFIKLVFIEDRELWDLTCKKSIDEYEEELVRYNAETIDVTKVPI